MNLLQYNHLTSLTFLFFLFVLALFPTLHLKAERKEQNAAKAAENAEKRAAQNEERKKKNAEAKEAAKTQVSTLISRLLLELRPSDSEITCLFF
jgi:flagellar biosynthesis component FlhA